MQVAFIGTRGIPARYSGFETCVQEVGRRMAAAGHDVTVFCRSAHYADRLTTYEGMRLIYLPAIQQKHLETLSHTALSLLRLPKTCAVICMGVGNAPLVRLFEALTRRRLIFNVDGADWQREKWEAPARAYLQRCEGLAATSSSVLVADARAVHDYFNQKFGRVTEIVAYGAYPPVETGTDVLARFRLRPRQYLLYVGRLVPENGAHDFLEGAARSGLELPAVVVGDAPYARAYITALHAGAASTVVFTGYQFGIPYQQLTSHAGVFVLAATVGGTHPVLLEQMAAGNCILARLTDSNVEVLGESGLFWRTPGELADLLRAVWADPERRRALGNAARERATRLYDWNNVTEQYLKLCRQIA